MSIACIEHKGTSAFRAIEAALVATDNNEGLTSVG